MGKLIEVQSLHKSYRAFRLSALQFSVGAGEIMALIGDRNAGKTTTVKLLLDLAKPNRGEIKLLGTELAQLDAKTRGSIGVFIEESCFPPNLSRADVSSIMKSTHANWDGARFIELCDSFELPEKVKIKTYGKNMRTKLMFACALSHGAKLLVLDEPTAGLDPIERNQVLDLLSDFVKNGDRAVFVTSHILSDLEDVATHITFIHKGNQYFSLAKDDLFKTFGLLRCGEKEFQKIEKDNIIGSRRFPSGIESLVLRSNYPGAELGEPTIEDVMVLSAKGEVFDDWDY